MSQTVRIGTLAIGAIALWLSITPLLGQSTGTIHGRVTDPGGLAVSHCSVSATLDGRGFVRTAQTNEEGSYVLPLLPVGSYSVRLEAKGFKQFGQPGVVISSNDNVRVDAQLSLGSVSETVTVSAEAPLVDSRSSQVGALIDTRRITELPTNGRNVIALAAILPGVSNISAPQTFTGDRGGPTINISGSRSNQNLFLLDGAQFSAAFRNTGLNYPPPDALQEVKVLTNNFNAEYGRNAGSIFNAVTKSGSNDVHGSAWEFFRNHNLSARNFFALTRPRLVQNQFGGAIGGPIRKDKLFLFGSYESLRVRTSSLAAAAFPLTATERGGAFAGAPVKDPLTGQPFPGNLIPANRIDPVAAKVLSNLTSMPLPNRPDGQLITTSPAPVNNDTFVVRMDYNLGKHTIDGRYNYNRATQGTFVGQVPSYQPLNNVALSHSAVLGDTFILTPNILNQVRVSYNRFVAYGESQNPTTLSDLGGNFPVFGRRIAPALTLTGRVTLGAAASGDSNNVNESYHLSDSVTWNRGTHSVKAGFDLLKIRYASRSNFQTMGNFTFNGTISGNAAADFVLGKPATLVVASPVLEQNGLQTNTYYYIQDDWRVHSRLTLNLGMRYELPMPWVHPADWWGTLRPGQQSKVYSSAPLGMVFPGDTGIPRGLVQTDKNNFAPRFGFAWDPAGNGRTSVRGAYGIFYDPINANIIENSSQPFRYSYTFQTPFSLSDPLRGLPAIPLTLTLPNPLFVGVQQVFFPDANLRTPYVQQFNLNVQREISKNFSLQVGYVGKLGRKLLMAVSANPAIYGPGATLGNTDKRRILQGFGDNNVFSTEGNSNYNALQMMANRRFTKSLSFQAAYSFSRSIDLTSGIGEGGGPPNVFDLRRDYALSDFQAKHIFSGSWMWELPRLAKSHSIVRGLLGGWQANGLVSAKSGQPINVTTGVDIALSGTANQRPNLIGNPLLPDNRSKEDKILNWFNRSAFAQPAAGTYGNVGRNTLLGAATFTSNLALFKSLRVPGREKWRLQFRSEFFNAFNNVNLGNPNASVNAGTRMGRITGADPARLVQLALKLVF